MRVSQVSTVLSLFVAAFLLLGISSSDLNEGIVTTNNAGSTFKIATPSRKVKGINGGASFVDEKRMGNGKVEVDDYRRYDPSPSSKASIRPGPIEHGTPLMPFIPKLPSPPSPPNNGH